jgi:hypothetical protein
VMKNELQQLWCSDENFSEFHMNMWIVCGVFELNHRFFETQTNEDLRFRNCSFFRGERESGKKSSGNGEMNEKIEFTQEVNDGDYASCALRGSQGE